MMFKGNRQPLVQEDLWELQEEDSTATINDRFQFFMKSELAAARVRLEKKLKKKQDSKAKGATFQNPMTNGLANGVSQDVLMMVRPRRNTLLDSTFILHFKNVCYY